MGLTCLDKRPFEAALVYIELRATFRPCFQWDDLVILYHRLELCFIFSMRALAQRPVRRYCAGAWNTGPSTRGRHSHSAAVKETS